MNLVKYLWGGNYGYFFLNLLAYENADIMEGLKDRYYPDDETKYIIPRNNLALWEYIHAILESALERVIFPFMRDTPNSSDNEWLIKFREGNISTSAAATSDTDIPSLFMGGTKSNFEIELSDYLPECLRNGLRRRATYLDTKYLDFKLACKYEAYLRYYDGIKFALQVRYADNQTAIKLADYDSAETSGDVYFIGYTPPTPRSDDLQSEQIFYAANPAPLHGCIRQIDAMQIKEEVVQLPRTFGELCGFYDTTATQNKILLAINELLYSISPSTGGLEYKLIDSLYLNRRGYSDSAAYAREEWPAINFALSRSSIPKKMHIPCIRASMIGFTMLSWVYAKMSIAITVPHRRNTETVSFKARFNHAEVDYNDYQSICNAVEVTYRNETYTSEIFSGPPKIERSFRGLNSNGHEYSCASIMYRADIDYPILPYERTEEELINDGYAYDSALDRYTLLMGNKDTIDFLNRGASGGFYFYHATDSDGVEISMDDESEFSATISIAKPSVNIDASDCDNSNYHRIAKGYPSSFVWDKGMINRLYLICPVRTDDEMRVLIPNTTSDEAIRGALWEATRTPKGERMDLRSKPYGPDGVSREIALHHVMGEVLKDDISQMKWLLNNVDYPIEALAHPYNDSLPFCKVSPPSISAKLWKQESDIGSKGEDLYFNDFDELKSYLMANMTMEIRYAKDAVTDKWKAECIILHFPDHDDTIAWSHGQEYFMFSLTAGASAGVGSTWISDIKINSFGISFTDVPIDSYNTYYPEYGIFGFDYKYDMIDAEMRV